MKTKLKSNPEKKAEMIRMLGAAIDKHTEDEHDLYNVIHAVTHVFEFIGDQRWELESDIMIKARYIEDDLKKKNQGVWLDEFIKMANIASEAMIISNQSWEGIQVILSMDEELNAISETYGG